MHPRKKLIILAECAALFKRSLCFCDAFMGTLSKTPTKEQGPKVEIVPTKKAGEWLSLTHRRNLSQTILKRDLGAACGTTTTQVSEAEGKADKGG